MAENQTNTGQVFDIGQVVRDLTSPARFAQEDYGSIYRFSSPAGAEQGYIEFRFNQNYDEYEGYAVKSLDIIGYDGEERIYLASDVRADDAFWDSSGVEYFCDTHFPDGVIDAYNVSIDAETGAVRPDPDMVDSWPADDQAVEDGRDMMEDQIFANDQDPVNDLMIQDGDTTIVGNITPEMLSHINEMYEEYKKDQIPKQVLDVTQGREGIEPALQDIGSAAIAEQFGIEMGSGFIPFELREGFHDPADGPTLTAERVAEIREAIPEFGQFLGMDTTKFHTSADGSNDKNIAVIHYRYEDVKGFIRTEDDTTEAFKEENVVPSSMQIYKQFGESVNVDNVRVGMTNLVTFEMRLKDDPVPYRTMFVIDDTGMVLGTCDGSRTIPLFPEIGGRIEFLDRTDTSNPGHIRAFDHKDDGFRQDFLQKLDGVRSEFLTDFCDKLQDAKDGHIEYLEGLEKFYQDKADYDKNVLTRVEFAREIDSVDLLKAEQVLKSDIADLKGVVEERTEVIRGSEYFNGLSDSEQMSFRANPISEQVSYLTSEEKAKYDACDAAVQERMETFTEHYKGYAKIKEDLQPEDMSEKAQVLRENYNDSAFTLGQIRKELDNYKGFEFDGKKTDFFGGIEDGEKLSPLFRFSEISFISSSRTSLNIPVPVDYKSDTDQEDLKDVDDKIKSVVDRYNEGLDEKMQIHVGEDSKLYTYSGFAVEPSFVANSLGISSTASFPGSDVDKLYNSREDFDENRHANNDGPIELSDGSFEKESLREYAAGKISIDGEDVPRIEVANRFVRSIEGDIPKDRWMALGTRDAYRDVNNDVMRALPSGMDHVMIKIMDNIDSLDKSKEEIPAAKDLIESAEEDVQKDQEDHMRSIEENVQKEQAIPTEAPQDVNDGSKMDRDQDARTESAFRRGTAGAYGKIDHDREVAISSQKMEELKQEVRMEIRPDGHMSAEELEAAREKLLNEKVDHLKSQLENVKSDILHYEGKMEKYSEGVPSRLLIRYVPFQGAKAEFDSAIARYEKMGGAVGSGEFVSKGANGLERFLDRIELYNTDIMESAVINSYFGRHFMLGDLYEIGKTDTKTPLSYCRMSGSLRGYSEILNATFGTVSTGIVRFVSKFILRSEIGHARDDVEVKPESRVERPEEPHIEPADPGNGVETQPGADSAVEPERDHTDVAKENTQSEVVMNDSIDRSEPVASNEVKPDENDAADSSRNDVSEEKENVIEESPETDPMEREPDESGNEADVDREDSLEYDKDAKYDADAENEADPADEAEFRDDAESVDDVDPEPGDEPENDVELSEDPEDISVDSDSSIDDIQDDREDVLVSEADGEEDIDETEEDMPDQIPGAADERDAQILQELDASDNYDGEERESKTDAVISAEDVPDHIDQQLPEEEDDPETDNVEYEREEYPDEELPSDEDRELAYEPEEEPVDQDPDEFDSIPQPESYDAFDNEFDNFEFQGGVIIHNEDEDEYYQDDSYDEFSDAISMIPQGSVSPEVCDAIGDLAYELYGAIGIDEMMADSDTFAGAFEDFLYQLGIDNVSTEAIMDRFSDNFNDDSLQYEPTEFGEYTYGDGLGVDIYDDSIINDVSGTEDLGEIPDFGENDFIDIAEDSYFDDFSRDMNESDYELPPEQMEAEIPQVDAPMENPEMFQQPDYDAAMYADPDMQGVPDTYDYVNPFELEDPGIMDSESFMDALEGVILE